MRLMTHESDIDALHTQNMNPDVESIYKESWKYLLSLLCQYDSGEFAGHMRQIFYDLTTYTACFVTL